ncbi:MAG TPA: hypothetical protein VG227_09190 [Caulobacteraceae bacterium]|nr:hypothetical protein [Caulobacteraceae bacterium]
MTSLDRFGCGAHSDAWAWWEARRLKYNLTLAIGGAVAYALAIGMNYVFGRPVWSDWRGALGMTLFLGVAYLLVLGVANVCYLLGPTIESWSRPTDVDAYRRRAWGLGRWGSLVVPLSFPLALLAMSIAQS